MNADITYFILACLVSVFSIALSKQMDKQISWKSYKVFLGSSVAGIVGAGLVIGLILDPFVVPALNLEIPLYIWPGFVDMVTYYLWVFLFYGLFTGSEIASKERNATNVFGILLVMLLVDCIFAMPFGYLVAYKIVTLLQMYGVMFIFALYSLFTLPVIFLVAGGKWPKTSEVFSNAAFVAIVSNTVMLFSICFTVALQV